MNVYVLKHDRTVRMSQSHILNKIDKIKYYIKIKTYNTIVRKTNI